jgi:hypothetical protein
MTHWRERKRAQSLLENVESWHESCLAVTDLCSRALADPATLDGDIGEVLDLADRKLYAFRSHMGEARREIQRHDMELAKRLTDVTEGVYHLRNQTARFLIRAQGAKPFTAGRQTDDVAQQRAYLKALEEAGYEGRELVQTLRADSTALWQDLQPLLALAHETLTK